MIAEAGHYALVLALGLALIQSTVPIIGARWRDPALMNVARSTALAQLLFVGASFAASANRRTDGLACTMKDPSWPTRGEGSISF